MTRGTLGSLPPPMRDAALDAAVRDAARVRAAAQAANALQDRANYLANAARFVRLEE